MKKKVSLKDVANHVGVSTALVSYVLNGKEKEARVSTRMAEKIRKVANQLKYQPNLIAKSLKSGKTNTIGLIVADISNPFFSSIARIVEDEAKKLGFVVVFGSSDESDKKQADLINVLLNRQVDAFIITPAANTEDQVLMLRKRGIPVVLIDRYLNGVEVDGVHIDNFKAAYDAVRHLIDNGRTRIGMVSYKNPMAHMSDRVSGYVKAMKSANIKAKKEWMVDISYSDIGNDMETKFAKLLSPLQLDAVLFASNSLAVAGLKRVLQRGISVPRDLAIISFDETEAFDFFYSPITYVSQPVDKIGKQAVERVVMVLEKGNLPYSQKVVDAELVVRSSSGIQDKEA